MRIYQTYTYAGEFNVVVTLELKDNGNFSYNEDWSSYGGGFGCEIHGVWRQTDDSIMLCAEIFEQNSGLLTWDEKQERLRIYGDEIIFEGSYRLSLQSRTSNETTDGL